MATLHFICGKAGAGKTTLARRLGRELSAVVICEDEWLSRLADPIASLADYLAATAKLRSVLTPHVVDLLRLGVSFVFDFAGNTVRDRSWVRSLFEQAHADHLLHYLEVDADTCLARVHERNDTKPPGVFFGIVTDAQLEEVNRYFVPPAEDEGFTVATYDARA